MYLWHHRLSSWAEGTGLRIDALGLVTLLGAEEMDRSIGRLVASPYFEYLPLLGAFVVAGNRFTEKKSGFTLYNVSAGIMTTELAGWFSRWLQTQDFNQVRSIVTWQVVDRPRRWRAFVIGFLLVCLPVHGVLIALTVLSGDWWGFANVMAMIVSVVVRCIQVAQNRAGIDANIQKAQEAAHDYPARKARFDESIAKLEDLRRKGQSTEGLEVPIEPRDPNEIAKVIVVTEDSKVITLAVPGYLTKLVFAINPQPPNRYIYRACQCIGWSFFAVHVISIGMAALYTQIVSVVVIMVATVLVAHRVGCEDSQIWESIRNHWGHHDHHIQENSCWVSSKLKATMSVFPEEYMDWPELEEPRTPTVHIVNGKELGENRIRLRTASDLESSPILKKKKPERRQDLLAWLDLTAEEDKVLIIWGLIPHSREWQSVYLKKKEIHRRRIALLAE
jgi:hypothetical protein